MVTAIGISELMSVEAATDAVPSWIPLLFGIFD
jgi:hypothetical protein